MILAQLLGQVLDEKYRIEKQLGQGGMGAVYLATHIGTKRPVALKVITPQFMAHAEFVERFKREAEAAGRLRHPNVVNVTDFGFSQLDGERLAYLVMEYLDGCNLGEVLNEESRLPLGFVVDIIEQVCAAVAEAHQQGIIHRDLKPDNIWLEPNPRGGYIVKVLDFGLAKIGETLGETAPSLALVNHQLKPSPPAMPSMITAVQLPADANSAESFETATQLQALPAPIPIQLPTSSSQTMATGIMPPKGKAESILSTDEGATQVQPSNTNPDQGLKRNTAALTRVGAVLGTPIYMSPEQCAGKPLDARTDIYSLGVIAYEMLAGRPPFAGNIDTLMAKHLSAPPPPLREQRKDIPKKIANLIMSALEKDPAARPASAAIFASTLRARCEGAGALLRQAIALYSEHFTTFLKISLISYLPLILSVIALGIFGTRVATQIHIKDKLTPELLIVIVVMLISLIGYTIGHIITAFAAVPIVLQLRRFPLRKVAWQSVFIRLRSRWRGAVSTTVALYARIFFWGIWGFFPGIVPFFRYYLVYPIFMIEGLSGKAALKRSRELVKRARPTVFFIALLQFGIPFIAKNLGDGLMQSIVIQGTIQNRLPLIAIKIFINLLGIAPSILLIPLIAILLVLLYFNTRLSGGETLSEELELEAELPATKWQQRMQERLRLRTSASPSGNTRQ